VVCEERINAEVAALAPLRGLRFVREALRRLDFSYRVAPTDIEHIPAEGRVVVVANHPLGALDALALLDLVGSVRSDVRIVGNRVLDALEGLGELLLPCEVFSARPGGASLRAVYRALEQDQAVILFPAGEVSRVGPAGIRDGRWAAGFARFALRCGAPVLPVHVAASNSPMFYGASMLAKPLGTLMLPRELVGREHGRISLIVGATVPPSALRAAGADPDALAAGMRRHVYRLARRKPPLFATEETIAHPEPPLAVRRELLGGELLGQTRDGKRIVLVAGDDGALLSEIGRLRELAFRRVGEGTGLRRDLDAFDRSYRHIVLWDEERCEVVGAYRLGECADLLARQGLSGLYSATLFDYLPERCAFLCEAVELGRSFVHPRYWGSRSLDYLWQGIGAYLRSRPQIRYLLGPVSLSKDVPDAARQWLVEGHRLYFGHAEPFAVARNPIRVPDPLRQTIQADLAPLPVEQGMALLRRRVLELGGQFPVLYRQYVDLCRPEGVTFADFSVDPAFGHCIDGLIRLDLACLKPAKRARYLGREDPP
jgi:putative hemolysin